MAKDDAAPGIGHNSKSDKAQEMIDQPHTEVIKGSLRGECDDVGGIAGKRLRAFLDRVARLEEEVAGLREDIKDVYGEAKATGFDVKIMRRIRKLEQMDLEKRREEDELLNLYKSAIGME